MAHRPSGIVVGAAASLSVIAVLVLAGCSGPADNPPTVGGEECLQRLEIGIAAEAKMEARDFRIDEGPDVGPRPIVSFDREFRDGAHRLVYGLP